jgi:hypothetical protein
VISEFDCVDHQHGMLSGLSASTIGTGCVVVVCRIGSSSIKFGNREAAL